MSSNLVCFAEYPAKHLHVIAERSCRDCPSRNACILETSKTHHVWVRSSTNG